jgi:hypothetical protein
MSVVYATAVKTARMQAVATALDQGTGAGKLKIHTSGLALLLVTFTLADPSGSASGDTLTLDMDPDLSAVASNDGMAAEATLTDSDDNVLISGLTVGTSGTDIVLDSVSITSGQTVTMATGTIQHAT